MIIELIGMAAPCHGGLVKDLEAQHLSAPGIMPGHLAGGLIHIGVQAGMIEGILHEAIQRHGLALLIQRARILMPPMIHGKPWRRTKEAMP